MVPLIIVLVIISVMSLITFILYGVDKRKAVKNDWRISEAVLLLFSVFGGAIGGTAAMYIFRHKTQHWYFVLINVAFVLIHLSAVFMLGIKALG